MTDYSDYSDDEQINENDLSLTERRQLKAEKALKRVVDAIYGYEGGTYPEQIYNQLHECIRLIGERLEKHKPKKGKFHAIFYMCYESDSGMPETPNTAYTILTTILRAVNAVNQNLITLNETFIQKAGYMNTDYFYVGAPYKFPTSKKQQQNAKNNYHDWFDNAPLNKILERFIDLMNGRTPNNTNIINTKAQAVERKADESIKALDDIEERKDEIDAKLKQIKKDIKALKQIKHDASTDEATREATKSTIKALKKQKKTIKHGKRRNIPKTDSVLLQATTDASDNGSDNISVKHGKRRNPPKTISRDVELTVKNEDSDDSEKASERLTEKRRKRLLAEALRRLTAELKTRKDEKERKRTEQNDILPTEQKMTTRQTYIDLILDFGHFDNFNNWRGYQKELNAVNDELQANGYAIPPELISIFEHEYITNLEDQLANGTITEVKARDILLKDMFMLNTDYAVNLANDILSEISGYVEPIDYTLEPVSKLADSVKSDLGLIPRVEEVIDDIKVLPARRVRLADPNRHGKRRNTPRPTPQTKRTSSIKPKIDVSVPGKIDANFNPKNMTATIRPVFKAKLTF